MENPRGGTIEENSVKTSVENRRGNEREEPPVGTSVENRRGNDRGEPARTTVKNLVGGEAR